MHKLILVNPLSPGDILICTNAIRDLHLKHPGKFLTDIRVPSGCEQIFENSPYITHIDDNDPEAKRIRLDYPDIHTSGWSGRPFATAHLRNLETVLGIPIEHTTLKPDIFLSQDEILWPSPVTVEYGYTGKYWVINAGIKSDYTLKYYPYYQTVVDLLKNVVQFVQVGQLEHNHPPLKDVIDMRGKTDLRQLFRLSYHAEGAVCAISLQMVIQMCFDKPCVVVAGGREGIRWQLYPGHRFLSTHGAIDCCSYDGCWLSKKHECKHLIDGEPLCMRMIEPVDIVRAIELYYKGGRLTREERNPLYAVANPIHS